MTKSCLWVVDGSHDGPTAVVQALVHDVAKRFLGRFKIPMHVCQPVGDVDVGHNRGLASDRSHHEVRKVAHVLVVSVGRPLAHAVHEDLNAWPGVVGVAGTN